MVAPIRLYTIDETDVVTVHAPSDTVSNTAGQTFATPAEFEKIAAEWPGSRLVHLWNELVEALRLEGLKPVRKFTDRNTAVRRIWKALERMPASVPTTAPKQAATPVKDQAAPKNFPRPGSKAAIIFALISRPEGATFDEITEATKWQAHSVRGFISGTLGKKKGLEIERVSRGDGEPAYYLLAR